MQAVHSVNVCAFLCKLCVSVQVVRFYAVARFCAFCASFAFLCNKWGVCFAQQFAQQRGRGGKNDWKESRCTFRETTQFPCSKVLENHNFRRWLCVL